MIFVRIKQNKKTIIIIIIIIIIIVAIYDYVSVLRFEYYFQLPPPPKKVEWAGTPGSVFQYCDKVGVSVFPRT
jgi:uncharacterized protein YxeA